MMKIGVPQITLLASDHPKKGPQLHPGTIFTPSVLVFVMPILYANILHFQKERSEGSQKLGLDHQRANKLARKLHAHSVMYANKLVTTRRANENKNTSCSQVMEPVSWWRGFKALLSQCGPFSLIDVGRVSSAVVFHADIDLNSRNPSSWTSNLKNTMNGLHHAHGFQQKIDRPTL
eukprot:1137252-Pelagomonas_calceolata.AAC.1